MKFDFDFLKSRYDNELKRKEQITTALTRPVSVLFILGTLMIAMAQSFSYMDGFLTCLFLIFLGLAAFASLRLTTALMVVAQDSPTSEAARWLWATFLAVVSSGWATLAAWWSS